MAETETHPHGDSHPGGGTPGQPHKPGEDLKKPKLDNGKKKWYLVGILGVVAVLVFAFVRKSNANSASTAPASTTASSLDPATQAELQSALQAMQAGSSSDVQG